MVVDAAEAWFAGSGEGGTGGVQGVSKGGRGGDRIPERPVAGGAENVSNVDGPGASRRRGFGGGRMVDGDSSPELG